MTKTGGIAKQKRPNAYMAPQYRGSFRSSYRGDLVLRHEEPEHALLDDDNTAFSGPRSSVQNSPKGLAPVLVSLANS